MNITILSLYYRNRETATTPTTALSKRIKEIRPDISLILKVIKNGVVAFVAVLLWSK
jgi:hypothetical protein